MFAQFLAPVLKYVSGPMSGWSPLIRHGRNRSRQSERVFGVEEWFLPSLVESLDEAGAVALLRALRKEAHADRFHKVLRQVTAAGIKAAKVLWSAQEK